MVAVLFFNDVYWFWQKNTLEKLVTMATKKRLSSIFKFENFAKLWKVTKFQGDSLFRFGVLSHLLGWVWKTPPGANRVKFEQQLDFTKFSKST